MKELEIFTLLLVRSPGSLRELSEEFRRHTKYELFNISRAD
jgi:hypothetical protein